MTPLEIAAKAHWDEQFGSDYPWEAAPQIRRDADLHYMRAALRALAQAEMPESVMNGDISSQCSWL